jgi:ketopantoate hydroxymethyltransferase
LKFTKQYANLRKLAVEATAEFVREVRDGSWPDDAHSFH